MSDAIHIHRAPKRKPRPPAAPKKQGDYPHCKICKAPIHRLEGEPNFHWLGRKVCVPSLDEKPVKCITAHINSTNKNRAKIRNRNRTKERIEYKKPNVPKTVPRISKMSQAEADRLDMEQMKINIAIHSKDAERCGYVNKPARLLSKEEIAECNYQPPMTMTAIDYRPGFRPMVKRGREMEL